MVQRGTGTLKLSNFIELSDAPFWWSCNSSDCKSQYRLCLDSLGHTFVLATYWILRYTFGTKDMKERKEKSGKPLITRPFEHVMKDLEAYCSSTLLPFSPRLFRTTVLDFLPSKLEPLGFSLDGQLRVAS